MQLLRLYPEPTQSEIGGRGLGICVWANPPGKWLMFRFDQPDRSGEGGEGSQEFREKEGDESRSHSRIHLEWETFYILS